MGASTGLIETIRFMNVKDLITSKLRDFFQVRRQFRRRVDTMRSLFGLNCRPFSLLTLVSLIFVIAPLSLNCGGDSSGGGAAAAGGGGGGGNSSYVSVSNVNAFSMTSNAASPSLLEIDSTGKIWVGDLSLAKVVRINPSTAMADCSTGCTTATLSYLRGMAIDGSDNIWVGDSPGNVGSPSTSNTALAMVNNGSLAVSAVYPTVSELTGGTATSRMMYGQAESGPLAIDNSGNIIVSGNQFLTQASPYVSMSLA